ncbi:MAG: sporulation protein YpjB [Paenibacillaceae bacterium]|jgi:sporulation protein YpjB|nr:sporulation protein YpjB [Paenibacillaceae bacterium]
MKTRRKVTIPLCLLGLMVMLALAGCGREQADSTESMQVPPAGEAGQLQELNVKADELYKNAAAGQYLEARKALEDFGTQAASISYAGVTGIEGVNALSDAVVEAKRQLNAARLDPEKVVHSAARLKLAADALTHKNQPMWLHYYKVLNGDTTRLEEAVSKGNQAAAKAAFVALNGHYDVIRPSVWISRTPEEGERMESLLVFFAKQVEPAAFQKETLEGGIRQWRDTLASLFRKGDDQSVYLPVMEPDQPILWTLTIGLVIAAVLSFAGWRMIRVEREAVRPPRFRDMDGGN